MKNGAIRCQRLLGLLAALLASGSASPSGEIAVTRLEHYTENRSLTFSEPYTVAR